MSLEKYQSVITNPQARFAVVNTQSNELIKTFQTNKVAQAFSQSIPNTRIVLLSKNRISDILRGQANS